MFGISVSMAELTTAAQLVELSFQQRQITIEYQWLGAQHSDASNAPLLVFLHEGLGSLSMWKDFPQHLCNELGVHGLVYSRPGYGQSTPRLLDEQWQPDFMHQQAHQLLPALLQVLGVDTRQTPLWLFGHSDGASIALLYAARYPTALAGAILLAPHIMVEALSLMSIRKARQAYLDTDLKQKLARYHADPDSAFWGWNDAWLNQAFAAWSIEAELTAIQCPLLAVQGLDDEYGTLQQITGIKEKCPQAILLELDNCGHSPHRDQADALIHAVKQFISENR